MLNSQDVLEKWQYSFDDLSGIFAYRSYILRTWAFFNDGAVSDDEKKKKKKGEPFKKFDRVNMYTASG